MGNYLNLYPLWGFEPCGSDMVNDTPTHNAFNSSDFGPFTGSGAAGEPAYEGDFGCAPYQHLSTCTGNPLEMSMNFMDNTGDACMYMFTNGQRKRMHATLAVAASRSLLPLQATHCDPNFQEDNFDISERANPRSDLSQATPKTHIQLFPNPATQRLNIVVSENLIRPSTFVEIRDTKGQLIHQSPTAVFSNNTYSIKLQNWPTGIYFIHIISNTDSATAKLVKEE